MKSLNVFLFAALVCVAAAAGRDCNFGCITLYDPICAINDAGEERTFSIDCEMDSHNCMNPGNEFRLLRKGECWAD